MKQFAKKGLSLLLTLSMLVSLAIIPVQATTVAAGNNGKTIYVSTSCTNGDEADEQVITSAQIGDSVYVYVNFANNPTVLEESIQTYQIFVGYDSSKVKPTSQYGMDTSPTVNLNQGEGLIGFTWSDTNGIASKGKILARGSFICIIFEALQALDEEDLASILQILPEEPEGSLTSIESVGGSKFTVVQTPALEVEGPTADIYTSTTLDTIKANLASANYIDATGQSTDVKADVQLSYKNGANLVEGENTLVATYNGVSCEFTVNAKPVAVASLEITSNPTNMTYSSGDTISLEGMVVKATMNDSTEQTDFKGYTVSVGETQVTGGETKVTVADFNGKKITVTANGKTAETSGALTVNKKSVTVPTADGTYTYTGAEQTFTVGNNTDATFYTITGDTKGTDAGTYKATAALENTAESQWTTGNTDDVPLTWTIGKGTYGETITGAANVPSKGTTNKSYSLSSLNLPEGFVDAKITKAEIGTNTSGLISDGVSVAEGGQSITFSTTEKAKDTTGTITLTISSKNYEDVTATLTLTAKDVTVDEATWNLATVDTEFVYGTANKDAVKIASGSYTAQDAEGKTLNGTLTVKDSDVVQNAGGGTITLVFTVTDEGDYKGTTVEKDVTVTIDQKEVTANWGELSFTYDGTAKVPNATAVGVNGETLTVTVSGEQTNAGTYDATASITSVSGGNNSVDNYTLTETTTKFTIAPKTLTVSDGTLAYTKEYDGTTATASATGALSVDKVGEDDVTVTIGSAVYADKTVGTGKTVNLSGLTLAGTKADNYVLAADTYTFTGGVITAKEVTVSGITAENKEYDGTTAATLVYTGLTITGMVEGDQLSATATGAFADKTVGTGKTVTISGITLTGADAANYVLADAGNQAGTTANITAKTLTLADGTVKVTKVYDGTTDAGTLTGELALTGAIENDTVSVNMTGVTVGAYPESGYGTYTVTLSGIALTGTDAGNYTVPETYAFTGATITKTVPTTAMLDYALTGVTYNGSAQGVTVTAKESIEGLGAITVKYTKDGETTTTAPVNAGTYTVTASLAEGANYAAQDLELGTYTIAKADRNLTVDPTSLLLYPGSLTAQINASTDTDADKSAVITYASDADSAVKVNAAGKVTAVANGTATITVTIDGSDNYNAVSQTVSVKALVQPLTDVSASSSVPGDKVAAAIENGKIVVSGAMTDGATLTVAPTAATVDGMTITATSDGTNVTVKVGETVVATYPIDTTAVVTTPASVDVTESTPDISVGAGIAEDDKSDVENALGDTTNTKVEGLAAAGITTGIVDAAQAALESGKDATGKDLDAKYDGVEIQVYAKIEAVSYSDDDTATASFRLSITPCYKVVAVDQDDPGAAEVVLIAETKLAAISGDVQVSVKLPSGFPTSNLFARHYLTGGGTETLRVKVSGDVATWTQSSFSEVELFSDARTGSITYTFADGSTQTVAYDAADVGNALPTDTKDGSTFQGWTIDGKTYTTLTSDLLTAINSTTLAATGSFKENTIPGGGGSVGGGGGSVVSTFVITASAGQGGTISPTGRVSVNLNANKQFTIQPKDGYVIADVLVDGVSVGAVSSYTFERVNKNHTISVTFKVAEAVDVADIFRDISTSTWCYDAVQFVYVNGLMNGTTTTTFEPNRTLNRGMWVTMLYRMAGSPAISGTEDFTDVDASTWCYDALLWASRNGIVNGFDDGTFRANAVVTRQQLVAILYRYAQYMGYDTSASASLAGFVDAGSVWAVEPMEWALAEGVLAGTSATTLSPNGSANRGQAATFLMRFMNTVA